MAEATCSAQAQQALLPGPVGILAVCRLGGRDRLASIIRPPAPGRQYKFPFVRAAPIRQIYRFQTGRYPTRKSRILTADFIFPPDIDHA
jgi:hypothetical protein